MKLERTKALIQNGVDLGNQRHGLIHVLEAALELVSLPGNDFSWSSWDDASVAKTEIQSLLELIRSGALPERIEVAVLFAPTGPLQEVSVSSGWAEQFLKVAEKFDEIEAHIWSGSA